jgi:hypothetical protein
LVNDDELERIWKEAGVVHAKYYPGLVRRYGGRTRQISVRMANDPAEIRTEHHPNTSLLARYPYTRMIGPTPWLVVHKRTIPTERPPLVNEVSANFC